MGSISRDGVEADVTEQRLLGTQGSELAVDAHLGLATGCHGRLQPSEKLHQSDAVTQHGVVVAVYLYRILNRFHGRHRRDMADHRTTVGHAIERIAGLIGIEQDVVLGILLQALGHIGVRSHTDALSGEIVTHLVSDLLLIYI